MRRFLCALMALSSLGQMTQAQEFPPVRVVADEVGDSERDCNIGHTSAIAAVESEFRKNDVKVTSGVWDLLVHLRLVALETSGTGCAVNYSFRVQSNQMIFHRLKQIEKLVWIEECDFGGLMTGPTYDLQTRLNDNLRDLTNMCISQYLSD